MNIQFPLKQTTPRVFSGMNECPCFQQGKRLVQECFTFSTLTVPANRTRSCAWLEDLLRKLVSWLFPQKVTPLSPLAPSLSFIPMTISPSAAPPSPSIQTVFTQIDGNLSPTLEVATQLGSSNSSSTESISSSNSNQIESVPPVNPSPIREENPPDAPIELGQFEQPPAPSVELPILPIVPIPPCATVEGRIAKAIAIIQQNLSLNDATRNQLFTDSSMNEQGVILRVRYNSVERGGFKPLSDPDLQGFIEGKVETLLREPCNLNVSELPLFIHTILLRKVNTQVMYDYLLKIVYFPAERTVQPQRKSGTKGLEEFLTYIREEIRSEDQLRIIEPLLSNFLSGN
jgi:hypothetical protein